MRRLWSTACTWSTYSRRNIVKNKEKCSGFVLWQHVMNPWKNGDHVIELEKLREGIVCWERIHRFLIWDVLSCRWWWWTVAGCWKVASELRRRLGLGWRIDSYPCRIGGWSHGGKFNLWGRNRNTWDAWLWGRGGEGRNVRQEKSQPEG